MRKLSCLIMTAVLLLGLTACSGEETRLLAGYCSFYPDGGLMSYCEYSYEYDKDGRLTCEYEYYNGYIRSTKEREYDGSGRCMESEYNNRDELVALREFDKNDNLIKETRYDYYGEIASVTDYNEDGLKIRNESFKGNHYIVEYEYDDDGKLIKETEEDHDSNDNFRKLYQTIYDSEGEVIQRTITSSDGSTIVDMRAETVEEDNKKTLYIYLSDYLEFITEKEYDKAGNLLNEVTYDFIDGEQTFLSSEEYEYDSEGRVIARVSKTVNNEYRYEYEYSVEGYLYKESTITYKWISAEAYGDGSDAVLEECVSCDCYDADGNITASTYTVGGRTSSRTVYTYENVKVSRGRSTTFDFRDDTRELDPRAGIVY